MPGSRHRRGFSSLPSCPHISHQMFTIKYSRASSVQFWAHCTCYRLILPDITWMINILTAHLRMKGWLLQLWQAADIIYNLFGSACYTLNLLCRENCLLLLNTLSLHFHFLHSFFTAKTWYNVAYFYVEQRRHKWWYSGSTTIWANTSYSLWIMAKVW